MTRRFNAIGVCLYGFVSAGLVACGDGGESGEGPWPPSADGAKEMGGATSTGGHTGTGGSSTGRGGTGTGGTGTGTGGTTAVVACTASFVNVNDGSVLSDTADADGDYCQNGYSYDVVVATTAPDGTVARLVLNGSEVATTTVSSATAKFKAAPIGNQGTKDFEVEIGDGKAACTTGKSTVTVDCLGMPSCNVSTPTFNPTARTALNVVAIANGGDRVSSLGSPYQTRFSVTTNVENGQPVAITVAGKDPVYGVAVDGVATFAGVTLTTDASNQVTATCTARSGAEGVSSPVNVVVDATAPDLVVSKGDFGTFADGAHFGPTDDADPTTDGLQIKICGSTSSLDAVDLASVLPAIKNNFCVSIAGNNGVCGQVVSQGNVKSGCVNYTCPGYDKFDLLLTLKDSAQNPTTITRTNVTCASSNPQVAFIDPVADDVTFVDPTKRILAADNVTPMQRIDGSATVAGAQYTVKACTSAREGSLAALSVGRKTETLTKVADAVATVETVTPKLCPSGAPNVLSFPVVTLPESLEDTSTFKLVRPTELKVTVTNIDLGVGEAVADVWVDSSSPDLTLKSPLVDELCGKYFASAEDIKKTFVIGAPVANTENAVTLLVGEPDGVTTSTYTAKSLNARSEATIADVLFKTGTSELKSISLLEPSGNSRSITFKDQTGGGCFVTVGQNPPPLVTWVTPLTGNWLAPADNISVGAILDKGVDPGWQGELKVRVESQAVSGKQPASLSGVNVQFAANDVPIGSPVAITTDTNDDTKGYASIGLASVPDGNSVKLSASTIAGVAQAGTGTIQVKVDTSTPNPVGEITFGLGQRRQTSFVLQWTAPSDTTGTVADYDVRVSKTPITTLAEFNAAEFVDYTGTPVAGQPDSIEITGRTIETNYYFAIRSIDAVGNRSETFSAAGPKREDFLEQILTPLVGDVGHNFGYIVDGGSDVNGDGLHDLLIGDSNGSTAYVFFGQTGAFRSTPSITITSTNTIPLGNPIAGIGDFNGDGVSDFAVAEPRQGNGFVYVFYGSKSWAVDSERTFSIGAGDANFTISANSNAVLPSLGDTKYNASALGMALARLGDFNGDSYDDFAISVPAYGGTQGQAVVVLGGSLGIRNGTIKALSVPEAFGAGAIKIDGEASVAGRFGLDMVGLVGTTGLPTLVVSAPQANVGSPVLSKAGRLYSFANVTGNPASIGAASYAVDGVAANMMLGLAGLAAMGDLGPSSQPALGVPLPSYGTPGRARLFSGAVAAGPFALGPYLESGETGGAVSEFGMLLIGGAVRGTGNIVNWVGTSRADILVSTMVGAKPRILFIDGTNPAVPFSNGLYPVNLHTAIELEMPASFRNFGRYNTASPSFDADTYPDFAVGDVYYNQVNDGRVIVYR